MPSANGRHDAHLTRIPPINCTVAPYLVALVQALLRQTCGRLSLLCIFMSEFRFFPRLEYRFPSRDACFVLNAHPSGMPVSPIVQSGMLQIGNTCRCLARVGKLSARLRVDINVFPPHSDQIPRMVTDRDHSLDFGICGPGCGVLTWKPVLTVALFSGRQEDPSTNILCVWISMSTFQDLQLTSAGVPAKLFLP